MSNREARRICFVTGTRAEFGLMRSTLAAIQKHPQLRLQLLVTGMHLDRSRGYSLKDIFAEGWKIDHLVPWRAMANATGDSREHAAIQTGQAMAGIARALRELRSEIVVVVGDRVEAFAAAAAGHLTGCVVAHVHGGDRALGTVDDSLRHSISKLAHVHFPATQQSARRLARLGEDRWRIHRVGSPGLDDIRDAAPWREIVAKFPSLRQRRFALLLLHPASSVSAVENSAAKKVLRATQKPGFDRIIVVHPNNDAGSVGIVSAWDEAAGAGKNSAKGNSEHAEALIFVRNLQRGLYLGLLKECAVLVGNSSSGIIEAASYGTPVLDVGARQNGRECGANVIHVPVSMKAMEAALSRLWRSGRPVRFECRNRYGNAGTGLRIARVLAHRPGTSRPETHHVLSIVGRWLKLK